ncbi:serine/threonine protein phosphatase [bacterium]|jgi:serine/threonine protein phosphatase 1|nr:serine/threonine protein phosphatase [bacterium]
MRRFAIGDIHGCGKALRSVIEAIDPQPEDEIIFLGDYIDRGPDSRDTIDQIIELRTRTQVVTLRGNHEVMLMGVAMHGMDDSVWLANGGNSTLASYGGSLSRIPSNHLVFFHELLPHYEIDDTIFVHASYDPDVEMFEQTEMMTYWTHLMPPLPGPHMSGKRVIVGHTPQPDGEVLDRGHLVCIDTYCFGYGYLTAYEIGGKAIIQANRHGHVKHSPMFVFKNKLLNLSKGCKSLMTAMKSMTQGKEPPSTSD